MRKAFRICGTGYSPQDPTGAALSSEGRWHKKGERMLYFAEALTTCVLELRVNGISYKTIREKCHYGEATLHDGLTSETVPETFYSSNWQDRKIASQAFGSNWYQESRSLILRVRCAVLPSTENILMNTNHPEFARIGFSIVKPVGLDARLVDADLSDT